MTRVTTAMIAQYLPSLLSSGSDTGQTSSACAQVAARKSMLESDANRDNVLTQDEVNISEEAFQKLDADKDGSLTQEELTAYLKENSGAIRSYVKNYLSLSEDTKTLDALMDYSESTESTSVAGTAANEYLKAKDADKDGLLSQSETGLSNEAFTNADANEDGSLSASELKTVLSSYQNTLNTYYTSSSTTVQKTDLVTLLLKRV